MKSLRIHYIQHVSFERLGYIETWAITNNHKLSVTKLYENIKFPALSEFDWLIIMGGPMSVYDKNKNSWFKAEKEFIKSTIKADKTIIGICLGSQILAEVLGAKVYPNRKKEIGWFPVFITECGKNYKPFNDFPTSLTVFHWHGDTFDLPTAAIHLFQTDICTNQAFIYNDKILGLQFHIETTPSTLKEMITNCRHELIPDYFVQTEAEIIKHSDLCEESNTYLSHILNYLVNS
jgi:GMP synthase-like glutamine amidotransferase